MPLWLGLQLISGNKPSREVLKQTIRDFPEDTNNCRCRDCRYHRMVNK